MINIVDKTRCCGCSACVQKCPKQCMKLVEDNEGFLYPMVDENLCVDCGICEKSCPELHPYNERRPLKVLAAINKDDEIRLHSSSGGIFYLLAQKTISEGGVVFGAKFDADWQVLLDYAETLEDVKPFMGSKYVQARAENAYRDAETFLREGRKVLFSGTPCQIAGLYHYLGKNYETLTTVDFVCHGVPSPEVWRRYLNEVVSAVRCAITDEKFRNKRDGWNKYKFKISYDEEEKALDLTSFVSTNHYMRAFLSDMILRPSCHKCLAKFGRSKSDMTIGDFWGIDEAIPGMDDDKGTGIVLVNSDNGYCALDWNRVRSEESSVEIACNYNAGLSSLVAIHSKREYFFSAIDKKGSIIQLINDCLQPTWKNRVRIQLSKLHQQIRGVPHLLSGAMGKAIDNHINTCKEILHYNPEGIVIDICFRNKANGWKSYQMLIKIK